MKYFLLLISTFLLIGTALAFAGPETCVIPPGTNANAADMLKACAGTTGINPNDGGVGPAGVRQRIITIAQTAITLGALLAVGAIVWAGIQYTRAYGEDEKLKHAKSTAIFAVIGLLLLMGAFPLVDIFINFIYNVTGS